MDNYKKAKKDVSRMRIQALVFVLLVFATLMLLIVIDIAPNIQVENNIIVTTGFSLLVVIGFYVLFSSHQFLEFMTFLLGDEEEISTRLLLGNMGALVLLIAGVVATFIVWLSL